MSARATDNERLAYERAIQRIKNQADFITIVDGLERRLVAMKDTLMVHSGEALTRQQGRAQELTDILKDLTKQPKE